MSLSLANRKLRKYHKTTRAAFFVGGAAAGGGVAGTATLTALGLMAGVSLSGAAAACASGAGILVIPYVALSALVDKKVSQVKHPAINFVLQAVLTIGMAAAAAALGAALLGAALHPLVIATVGGAAIVAIAAFAFRAAYNYFSTPKQTMPQSSDDDDDDDLLVVEDKPQAQSDRFSTSRAGLPSASGLYKQPLPAAASAATAAASAAAASAANDGTSAALAASC